MNTIRQSKNSQVSGSSNYKYYETAYADLEDIETCISLDSQTIARRFILRVFDKIEQLYEYPESGKPVPEINDPSVRELLLNKYRIIYQLNTGNRIDVLRVVHGSRLLDILI